ncbi:protein PHYLLO, chloroplastic isoform X3 [Aristolochia californica]|uniref:protein PHYLLO, chloroplastic isoform X3 n=1 Tax=Aristolochia californica TaxID=171875 RepID=UPI0035D9FD66
MIQRNVSPRPVFLPSNESIPRNTNLLPRLSDFNRPRRICRSPLICHRLYSNLKAIKAENSCDGRSTASEAFSGLRDSDMPVELCFTHILPPALTLEVAAWKIREEVKKYKSNPPCSRSGILRFQVAVPPGIKALNWLLSQPHSSTGFPQFHFSRKQLEDSPVPVVLLDEICGVSGFGAAIYFFGSLSENSKFWSSITRYLCVDAPMVRAYGFIGIKCESTVSLLEHGSSCYYFIPQIELDELESSSILAATLAWDDSLSYSFDKAVQTFELCLCQAAFHASLPGQTFRAKWTTDGYEEPLLIDVQNVHMVCLDAHSMTSKDGQANLMHLEEFPTPYQFYFRLSTAIAFTNDESYFADGLSSSMEKCANINAVWASLIVEECHRLGLTYFCIAPGSRSSPLAIAASAHSSTTCVSCYDERSLAFHALGFGRGSHVPAVVITSSGTAVSNLLPAVVEASQDFVPLLLLTADRPPELLDSGANQAINQVNHFGSFVRHFFSLPPPTDQIPARMVLTTVGSAVHIASQAPRGPVHINCSFREPLESTTKEWSFSCLKGLELWMSGSGPFTTYIRMKHSRLFENIQGQLADVTEIIQSAKKGLLLIGSIQTEDEIWAVLSLAKHLLWPVVADILSGLRLRKILKFFPHMEKKVLFIDHLDHALLSEKVRLWADPDIVLQVGSRITSKRIAQMLESCCSSIYIMVDKHPFRHDPSHIVTHRIQADLVEFTHCLLKVQFPRKTSKWNTFLQALNMMIAWEMSFQISCQCSLTEPYVAQVISKAIPDDAAFFLGNSLAIRDMDMYGHGWVESTADIVQKLQNLELPCWGVRVAGNRGASGIDGLLSTAVGFAVGCNKRVFCLIGDISFLHDTNGLSILKQRTRRKPMTILVLNNHGGAIFSLLPLAEKTEKSVMHKYFYTSHDISVRKLCEAHSVKHLKVRTKKELQNALYISQQAQTDCLIEVESCIENNAAFHRVLAESAMQAADHTLSLLRMLSFPIHVSDSALLCKIDRMRYSLYRIQLCAPLTSATVSNISEGIYREGFIISLSLEDGSVGCGEVAPIEIHKEDLTDVEEQLKYLLHVIQGAPINCYLPLLRGSFASWISRSLGILPCSIFPSVRSGLEMAVLNALAARQGSSLSDLLLGSETHTSSADEMVGTDGRVQICALVDSSGSPKEVAHVVAHLVDEGFTTIKLKVGRRGNPDDDVSVVKEIREKVSYHIKLRVDANKKWTYAEAVQFGSQVKCYDLQYIEEPLQFEDDIIRFCEETGVPAALDETIDNIREDPLDKLAEFTHPGIVAIVIKPSIIGGFENAALMARWAQQHGKMAVISGTFESSLSLATYVQFAHYLEQQNADLCKMKKEKISTVAHGLGTYRWLKEDVITPLKICLHPHSETVEASVHEAACLLQSVQINSEVIQRSYHDKDVQIYQVKVDCVDVTCVLEVWDTGADVQEKLIVFLHGFLGTGEDWIPIMKGLSASARCISVNLPGHGRSKLKELVGNENERELSLTIELMADILNKVVNDMTPKSIILVGYSMGARLALYMALRCSDKTKIAGAVIISGSPGLRDEVAQRIRASQDDAKATYLRKRGLECFLEMWYAGDMWNRHPNFEQIINSRRQHEDLNGLAKSLSCLSLGRQASLWEDLKQCKKHLLFVVGEEDRKFRKIAQQMCNTINSNPEPGIGHDARVTIIPDCGHAVHLENPLPVIRSIRKFVTTLHQS